eukprot:4944959-Prymnesium_polylepis.1
MATSTGVLSASCCAGGRGGSRCGFGSGKAGGAAATGNDSLDCVKAGSVAVSNACSADRWAVPLCGVAVALGGPLRRKDKDFCTRVGSALTALRARCWKDSSDRLA